MGAGAGQGTYTKMVQCDFLQRTRLSTQTSKDNRICVGERSWSTYVSEGREEERRERREKREEERRERKREERGEKRERKREERGEKRERKREERGEKGRERKREERDKRKRSEEIECFTCSFTIECDLVIVPHNHLGAGGGEIHTTNHTSATKTSTEYAFM